MRERSHTGHSWHIFLADLTICRTKESPRQAKEVLQCDTVHTAVPPHPLKSAAVHFLLACLVLSPGGIVPH
jgi:hypothetical protein